MSGRQSGRRGRGRGRGRLGKEASKRNDQSTPRSGNRTPSSNSPTQSKNATPRANSFPQRGSLQRVPLGHNHDVGNQASPIPITDSRHQEDLQQRQLDMSGNQHEFRSVKKASSPATANDFQTLLAGINKLEERDHLQTAGRQVSLDHEQRPQIPQNSPFKDPFRLGEVLDAIAGFCVAQEKGETVAIGMETTPKNVNLMVATNSDVPQATTKQLQSIWESMKNIAAVYHHQTPIQGKVPPKSLISSNTHDQLIDFAQMCFSYSFQKWRKRVNGKLYFFKDIPYSDLPRTDPFIKVREHVCRLIEVYAASTAEVGKPNDKGGWLSFVVHLRDTQKVIQEFFDTNPFSEPSSNRYARFPSLQRYLRNVTETLNQLDILDRAARSQSYKHVFAVSFNIQALPSISTKATAVPRSAKDWEAVFERAAGAEYDMYDMDMHVISADAAYMSREAISMHIAVHCELKIALQAMRGGNRMYSYIGASELSCRGCQVWLQAFNKVHYTRFCTRGSHGKAYYPWQLPQNSPRSCEVTEEAYHLLAGPWLTTYHGYRPKKVGHLPDSTAPSGPSEPGIVGDREFSPFDSVRSLVESLPVAPRTGK